MCEQLRILSQSSEFGIGLLADWRRFGRSIACHGRSQSVGGAVVVDRGGGGEKLSGSLPSECSGKIASSDLGLGSSDWLVCDLGWGW